MIEEAFDYVVIGSGAAGATAARVLAETGRTVAIAEEGPRVDPRSFVDRVFPSMRTLYRDMGLQQASSAGPMLVLQGRCVGGSTVINSAIVRRMPEAVWAGWRDEHGLGDALPYAALERNWERIERDLSAAPTPAAAWGGNNALMDRGRAALGIAGAPMMRYVRDCHGSARCQLGCPHAAKQSMDVTYIPQAEARGARVLSGARVDRITWDGEAATGVAGPSLRLVARRGVVVAASAIQTPLLLARSGVRSPHLGRHFQAHPGCDVVGVFDRPVRMWSGATQGYEIDEYRDAHRAKLETVALPPELYLATLPGVGREWVRAMAESENAASWAIALRARAEGRVRERFGRTSIELTIGPRDVDDLRAALRRTVELLFAAGARTVIPNVRGLPDRVAPGDLHVLDDAPKDPAAYSFILSHLFGTARMSRREADGVLAPDFTVHGRRNVFVVDSSLFPTNLGVNPQHTIMAIAMHAAERIAER